jgi:hypothetical protein
LASGGVQPDTPSATSRATGRRKDLIDHPD